LRSSGSPTRTAPAQRSASPDADAVTLLLLRRFRGLSRDLEAAERLLRGGATRFAETSASTSRLARAAFFSDRADEARQRAKAAHAKRPDSVEALLVLATSSATRHRVARRRPRMRARPHSPPTMRRPWHGLGVVESERENVRRHVHISRRRSRSIRPIAALRELGTLESFAGKLPRARRSSRRL
jgi:hypothetical protein